MSPRNEDGSKGRWEAQEGHLGNAHILDPATIRGGSGRRSQATNMNKLYKSVMRASLGTTRNMFLRGTGSREQV